MKPVTFSGVAALLLAAGSFSRAATCYVSQTSTNPVPPYLTWATAATNIQAGISSAAPDDTVLVGPGVYQESVLVGTNSVYLVSANGPSTTVITAPGTSAVIFGVYLQNGTADALLQGFTLSNSAAGVHVTGGFSPTIFSNAVVNCETGVDCGSDSSPVVRSNVITGCSGNGIQLSFTATPTIEGNRINANVGGGMALWAAGTPEIRNNIISSNRGDGISMQNQYAVNIIQNLILANGGRGLVLNKPQGGFRGPWAINNTIVDNGGAGITMSGFPTDAEVVNNIVVGDPPLEPGAGIFQFNDFFPSHGTVLSGDITNLIGTAGNISSNPYLVCQPGPDYRLLAASPCIDAGTNGADIVLTNDFDGLPRLGAGSSNAPARIDMGAFEFAQADLVPCEFIFCPTNLVVIAAAGQTSAPVTYNGAYATPGASLSYSPPSGSVFPAGDDPVTVSGTHGTNALNCGFTISVLTTDDYTRALNMTNLIWTSRGDASWFVQNAVTYDGLAAAQSGAITNGQASTLQTVISGPATLTFWWKISSEANHDFVSVSVNGSPSASISGNVNWQQQTVYLGFGPQTVQWVYAKDAFGSDGQDAAWLDLITVTPGTTPPFITSQAASVAVAPGQTANFSAAALGTPPLAYQWYFNGAAMTAATGSLLSITNVGVSNIGTYSLTITNAVGLTNTVAAILNIAQVVAWGASSYGQTNVPYDLTNVVAVAGGYHHGVALKSDGSVVAWGANNAGQTNVPALSNAIAIASRAGDFSMALRSNGTIVVWGDTYYHQGNVPSAVTNAVAIAAGGGQGLALQGNGTAISWGYLNTFFYSLTNGVAIAAGDNGNLALHSDGTIGAVGQPSLPAGLSNVIAVAEGDSHALALKQDGTVTAWGNNGRGQTNVPAGLSNVVAIAAGDWHSAALKSDGTVVVWGTYSTGSGYIPAVPLSGLSNVIAIAAGSDHDVALLGNGPPIQQAIATNPRRATNTFSLSVPAQSGRTYRLEFRNALADTSWTALPLVAGSPATVTLSDTNASSAQRFYRVRRW